MVSGKTSPLDDMPDLANDNGDDLDTAAQHLRNSIDTEPVPARLRFLAVQLGAALKRHQQRDDPE